jgi:hypothetical protein
VLTLVVGLMAAPALATTSAAITLRAAMSGRLGVPKGAPSGKGTGTISVSGRKICWTFSYSGIDEPLAASIDKLTAGTARPPAVQLGRVFSASGCITALSARIAKAIALHPGAYDVEIRTASYPRGAIRGRLSSFPQTRLYRFSSGDFALSFDAPPHGNPPARVHFEVRLAGAAACGRDPVSAAWSIPYTVTAGASKSGSVTADFSMANPFRIYDFVDFLEPKGSVSVDLRMLPGVFPQMQFEVTYAGAVSNLAISPSPPQRPIEKTPVTSC